MAMPQNNDNDDSTLQLEAKAAAQSFGFSPQIACLHGSSDHSLLVSALTSEGKTTKLFLKWSESEPAFQIWLYFQLFSNGFRLVPDYFKTEDSAITFALFGKYWTCQPYIGSEFAYEWLKFDCGWQHCFRAGEALAALHASGSKILSKRDSSIAQAKHSVDLFNNFPLRFQQTIEEWTNKVSLAESSAEQNQLSFEAVATENSIRRSASELLQALPFAVLLNKARDLSERLLESEEALSKTINHGDFHPGNILFSGSSVLAVVDWEFACIGSAIYDLSYALFMFCLEPPVRGKVHKELFSSRKIEAFLDGYSRSSTCIKSMQRLSLYTEFVHLLMLDWACAELCKPDSAFVRHPGFLGLASALACFSQ